MSIFFTIAKFHPIDFSKSNFSKSLVQDLDVFLFNKGPLQLLEKKCEVEIYFSKQDSNMFTLVDEGFISNYVDDYHNMELAIINTSKDGFDEYIVFEAQ